MGVSYLQTTADASDQTTYTFAGQNLGVAANNRYIIVCISARKGGAVTTINTVTIGGVAATIVHQQSNGANGANMVGIAMALVPTGTTGDVVVTFGTGVLRCVINAYRATEVAGIPAFDELDSTAADPTVNLDIPAGGFAIGVGMVLGTASATWTGLTEDSDTTAESNINVTSAHDTFATVQTDLPITIDFASGTVSCGVFASWAIYTPSAGNFFEAL